MLISGHNTKNVVGTRAQALNIDFFKVSSGRIDDPFAVRSLLFVKKFLEQCFAFYLYKFIFVYG